MNNNEYSEKDQFIMKLHKQYMQEYIITSKDETYIKRGGKVGGRIPVQPKYETTVEAFDLLVNYYSKIYLAIEIDHFLHTVKKYSPNYIKGELAIINEFIAKAEAINAKVAADNYGKIVNENDLHVYVRLKEGFYENLEIARYPDISVTGLVEAKVYGRYFLFKEFLENKLKEFGSPTVESLLAPGIELSFIKDLENQLDNKYKEWRTKKIITAAFCQALFIKKYFKEPNWAKACKDFSLLRYDINIEAQVQSSKKVVREGHVKRILIALFPK